VVDTDVVAAALLGEAERGDEAAHVLQIAEELLAPTHLQAELANVVWKATVLGHLADEGVAEVLATAGALPIKYVSVNELWEGGVARAILARHPVYDTLFIELAERESALVVSYDRPLRERFPERVRTPAAVLAEAHERRG
jgi:predicted nucleic acid-binding protein